MNLGGRRITNDDLRSHFADLGFEGLATFRASGNVIFDADRESEAKLIARIEDGLKDVLGYEVPVFLRSASQIIEVAAHQPFPANLVDASHGKLQVGMLSSKPSKKQVSDVLALATDDDRLDIREREIYWLPRGGLLESPLDLRIIAASLGAMTVRTKGTVDLIVSKHFSDAG